MAGSAREKGSKCKKKAKAVKNTGTEASSRSMRSEKKKKKVKKSQSALKLDDKKAKSPDKEEDKNGGGGTTAQPVDETVQKRQKVVATWMQHALDMGVQALRDEFRALAKYTHPEMTVTAFKKNHEFQKNRYQDVPCQDQCRVSLVFPGTPTEYIHANYVGTPQSAKRFICTQGPLDWTMEEFWVLVVQEECDSIIMLCNCIETGKNKCAQYWPQNPGESRTYVGGAITVTNTATRKLSPDDQSVQVCVLQVKAADGTDREVRHFQWLDWPDRGVPPTKLTSLELLSSVRKSKAPILVHCSAGIGRTGTIVAIEYILERIVACVDCYSMGELLKELRNQRAYTIQNDLQYIYIHRIIMAYFLEKHRALYENVLTEENQAKYKKFVEDYTAATGQQ